MSWWLDKVYHFVHIWFDPWEHPLFEEWLVEVLQKIAEETKEGVRSAIIFADEPLQNWTKIPVNIWRRKRLYNSAINLNPNLPIIQWFASGLDFYKIRDKLTSSSLNWNTLSDSQKINIIRESWSLETETLKTWRLLFGLWANQETQHFICWEYFRRCVDSYAKIIELILWYKTEILGENYFWYGDIIDWKLAKNPCLVLAWDV